VWKSSAEVEGSNETGISKAAGLKAESLSVGTTTWLAGDDDCRDNPQQSHGVQKKHSRVRKGISVERKPVNEKEEGWRDFHRRREGGLVISTTLRVATAGRTGVSLLE
jgi:hypothetical protein